MSKQPVLLVVEDDQICAELLVYLLTRKGFAVFMFTDGLAAQNWLASRQQPVDCVLLDLMLPLVDGYQLLCQIKTKKELAGTPVIILSAKMQEQDIVRAFELGATDYVTKPFQVGELLARIMSRIHKFQRHG
jgi:DNA-binding response OmpR family regulator